MKLLSMDTFDAKKINVNIWDEVVAPVGAVVIAHGMAEHAERYDTFAKYLNGSGYVVLADDHRGHRHNCEGEKGIVAGDSFAQTVEDIKMVVNYAKTTYKTEVVLLGHSYGSFLSQRFMELYSDLVKGVILSGTAYMKTGLTQAGKTIASLQCALCGAHKIGYMIDKMSFGSYNKPFAAQGQAFAWLSRDKAEVDKYEKDPYCGYPLSLGFYKSFLKGVTSMYGKDADGIKKDLPVLIAVGSDDPVSNKTALSDRLNEFYKEKGLIDVTYKIYDGARHEILNETNRAAVYADFLAFLKRVL